MMKKRFFLYFMAVSIPLLLALMVWQSNRYQNLNRELARLEQTQAEWIESNKKLIAGITEYSSPYRIEYIAENQLNLQKIRPEDLLQVKIVEGKGHGY
ncbi:MAG: cell division protein FtsL [Treponema sp.]|jgi:cell division protein FtsL|nr:cell division protein FtsL [Treponema sp.]